MKANIFGKGKKDSSGGKAGGGRGKNSGGGAGDAGTAKSRLSGQARRSAEARERPLGRPSKHIWTQPKEKKRWSGVFHKNPRAARESGFFNLT